MPFELVIFDCDGVLVDSEPISCRVLTEHLGAAGFPMTAAEVERDCLGRSWASNVAVIEARFGRPLPGGFQPRYQADLFAAFDAELRAVPGVERALDAVAMPTCVASSGTHERIRHTLGLTGLLARFDGRIFSATDVEHGKPAPDLFLHAAASMGAAPERCAVIEDSPAGVQAARAAGMTVLGFAARSDPARLADEGARTFAAMAELPELLAGPCDPPERGPGP
jgi:HAD superfamily hydrolase (TIGR01509 family)